MRVASGCLNLSVTEELADHRLTFAEGKGLGRKAVSEVVNSPLFQPGAPTDAPPRMLKADRC